MIDTGVGISSLRTFARDFLDKPVTAVATHVHSDHIGSRHEFDDCIVHPLEMDGLLSPTAYYNIAGDQFDANALATWGCLQLKATIFLAP